MLKVIWDVDRKGSILKEGGTSYCRGIFVLLCRDSPLGIYYDLEQTVMT
jgi:hypothetical protein